MADEPTAPFDVEGRSAEMLDRVTQAVDDLVPESDYVGNEVLRDQSRLVRWAGTLFAVCSILLIPWIIVIAVTPPSRQISPNYDIAWAGFDVFLFGAWQQPQAPRHDGPAS